MKIAIMGTGYVGLVTGTCLAESGNKVVCVDINQDKITRLNAGEVPIYEPGLKELIARGRREGRLSFTTNLGQACQGAKLVFLAVGTPQSADGSADLSMLFGAVEQLAAVLPPSAIVVVKSTVPVGTNAEIARRLHALTGRACEVASNPEFLKEGAAVDDFQKPDRVVIGARTPETGQVLRDLYAPFLRTEHPCLIMSPESAELTKYAANAMLATKISFINEIANLSELLGADINEVRRGMGHDARIGFAFLFPGVGYGGSCFPKDVRALQATGRDKGFESQLLPAVDAINTRQKTVLGKKIASHFSGSLAGKTIAVWGLSFKPRTDDIREAPALVLLDELLRQQVRLQVYDPEATANVQKVYGDKLIYAATAPEALDGADALAILTEWNEFRHPDFEDMRRRMAGPIVFDGRNLFEPNQMQQAGFSYYSIGRRPVFPSA